MTAIAPLTTRVVWHALETHCQQVRELHLLAVVCRRSGARGVHDYRRRRRYPGPALREIQGAIV